LRVDLEFRISTDNDLDKVKLVIYNTIAQNKRVMTNQKIEIVIGKFTEGLILLNVRPFCLPGDTSELISELYEAVKVAFEVNGIKLAVVK
jgi:small-conductance mechanosensitive channel